MCPPLLSDGQSPDSRERPLEIVGQRFNLDALPVARVGHSEASAVESAHVTIWASLLERPEGEVEIGSAFRGNIEADPTSIAQGHAAGSGPSDGKARPMCGQTEVTTAIEAFPRICGASPGVFRLLLDEHVELQLECPMVSGAEGLSP